MTAVNPRIKLRFIVLWSMVVLVSVCVSMVVYGISVSIQPTSTTQSQRRGKDCGILDVEHLKKDMLELPDPYFFLESQESVKEDAE